MEGPRAVRPEEVGSLVELTNRVFRKSGGDMGTEFSYFLGRENAPHLRVFVDAGRVVSHCGWRPYEALIMGARIRVGCIGAVCTDPAATGRGLASALLADSFADMRAAGIDLAMISGTRSLYARAGAVTCGSFRSAIFDPAARTDRRNGVRVTPVAAGDAPRLAAIYRREPVRFIRPPSEWAEIASGRWCMNRPAQLFSIFRGEDLVAYAAIRDAAPWTKDAGDDLMLGEYAGCRFSLAEALPRLSEACGGRRITVFAAGWDAPLIAELAARGIDQSRSVAARGSAAVVNFPQLMSRLREAMVERAGPRAAAVKFSQSGEKVQIELDAERLEVSAPDACRIVFGTPERDESRLLEGRGELGRLLLAALPAWVPWYGFSYV